MSQPTMARIERGDPSVAMASYVMCLWLINQAEGLAELIAPVHDHAALEREVTEARARWNPSSLGSRPARQRPVAERSGRLQGGSRPWSDHPLRATLPVSRRCCTLRSLSRNDHAKPLLPTLQNLGYQALAVGSAGTQSCPDSALTELNEFGIRRARATELVRQVARTVDGWEAHSPASASVVPIWRCCAAASTGMR